ncbi:MAG TPA: ATP-binding protein, partial [Gaiellaceae bacterium]|nr:ATP-binding protein [Gaiellaceae bacterium]
AAEERAAAATALMHVAEAVVLVDDDGAVRVANPAAGRLLGVEAGAAIGRPLAELVPGWASLAPRIPVTRDGESASVLLPLALAGGTRWVRATAEHAPAGIVFTLRDVTDERRLDELRDDIVAVVSHELRTPLAGVLGAAQTLTASGDRLDDETRRSLVSMIAEQSGRLARILDQMLLTQRLDAGSPVLSRGTFDAGKEVARAVADVRRRLPEARIELEPAAQGEVEAEGDAVAFEQVVVNLLDNALKYGDSTPVRLRLERNRDSVRLTVADEGPGIAPGDRERVFEKFLRLDSGQVAGGTGLGLYISRELVRRMRGRIGILDSTGGTTFFVDLPAARG